MAEIKAEHAILGLIIVAVLATLVIPPEYWEIWFPSNQTASTQQIQTH